jgi:hypothetical protein
MGHQRLGDIPKTKRWETVVERITGTPTGSPLDVPHVASQTLSAAEEGLDRAISDPGLRFTFYLLTQLVLAAREEGWESKLEGLGIQLSAEDSLFDLTAELQKAIDEHVRRVGRVSAISEMAQQAGGEAIASLAGPGSVTLFGSGRDELQSALRKLSTKAGFANLGQAFFGSFIARFVNFYLSRITASQIGETGLSDSVDLSSFNEDLRRHCHQSARIVHDFCGEWYSKTEFQQGISLDNTSGFLAVALRKLQDELRQQREAS